MNYRDFVAGILSLAISMKVERYVYILQQPDGYQMIGIASYFSFTFATFALIISFFFIRLILERMAYTGGGE